MALVEREETTGSYPNDQTYRVLALYKFVVPRLQKEALTELQAEIEQMCRIHSAKGTLLLAEEGINGTICYPFDVKNGTNDTATSDDTLLTFLQSKFDNALRVRISYMDRPVFARLKIKIKREIVTIHWEGNNSNDDVHSDMDQSLSSGISCTGCFPAEQVGEYVKPQDWNQLLLDPDTLVVDARNEYEIDVGTFRNAVNPHTQSFVEFPDWMKQHLVPTNLCNSDTPKRIPKKIAMFCTGGIRCEKATSACLQLVPKDVPVYHLEGGILAYLNDIPREESLFDGDCYVFDQRVAVTYGLQPSSNYQQSCHGCRHPLSIDDLKRDDFVEGVSCRYCTDHLNEKNQERYLARQRQIELAMQGKPTSHDIFLRDASRHHDPTKKTQVGRSMSVFSSQ